MRASGLRNGGVWSGPLLNFTGTGGLRGSFQQRHMVGKIQLNGTFKLLAGEGGGFWTGDEQADGLVDTRTTQLFQPPAPPPPAALSWASV